MSFKRELMLSALAVSILAVPSAVSAQALAIDLPLKVAVPSLNAPERLASIAERKCDQRTASGLGYSVLKAGEGVSANARDFARVGYAGYFLTTGGKFDGNDDAGFHVNRVVPGFSEGLQLMNRGAKYRLCIPAKLGYGERGAGGLIPPNSNLIFLLQLHDF